MLILLPLVVYAVRWPLGAGDEPRVIFQSYGQLQDYGANSFLHTGIDILGAEGEAVYAAAPGIVKRWKEDGMYSWLSVADQEAADSCDGWLYAHFDPYRYHKEIGEWVKEGDLLGYLVPGFSLPHLHWMRVCDTTERWGYHYFCIGNPAMYLEPSGDTIAPIFEEIFEGQLFGFKKDNSADGPYLSPDSLYGDVDVIALIHDKTGFYSEDVDSSWRRLIPTEAWIEIHGPLSTRPIRSFSFNGILQWKSNLDVIYTFDSTCHSGAKYSYFNLTNTDGDSLREESDYDSCWHTADFPDGNYWVVVTAKDAAGNATTDSMQVTLCNGVEFDKYEIMFDVLSSVVRRGEPLTIYSQAGGVLRIYDVSGRRRYSTRLEPSTYLQEINIGELTPGVYFVRIDAATPLVQKIIVLY